MGKEYFWRLFTESGDGKKKIYMRAIRKEAPTGAYSDWMWGWRGRRRVG